MAKYIDREALIDWLKRIRLIDLSDGLGLCRVIMEDDFKKAIKKMPKGVIADVAPVRHGRITNGGRMKKYKLFSQVLIFALIIIAAVVAFILAAGKSAWILIIVYWVVLTIKNIVDLIVFQKNK